MPQLLWDASALVKRSTAEVGSNTADALFTATLGVPMVCTPLSYAEAAAVLRRRFNQATLSPTEFATARLLLEHEVLNNPGLLLISVDDAAVLADVALSDHHNLNASDGAILAVYLRYAHAQPPTAPNCVLVASDHRLLRAAVAEGLATINPEMVPAADVPALLASL